ncbi:hypothetical protein GA0070215_13321 [Micromonospora marina]|uniref:Uncharacterized protein n=1 Tax=Micromonospora marina TaxID=307120 RepID=A0A1C5AJ83_9ACTN|nr:hypothetical protein GA0070215_13321 [Micromonospora marina]
MSPNFVLSAEGVSTGQSTACLTHRQDQRVPDVTVSPSVGFPRA